VAFPFVTMGSLDDGNEPQSGFIVPVGGPEVPQVPRDQVGLDFAPLRQLRNCKTFLDAHLDERHHLRKANATVKSNEHADRPVHGASSTAVFKGNRLVSWFDHVSLPARVITEGENHTNWPVGPNACQVATIFNKIVSRQRCFRTLLQVLADGVRA
jgi:hypothetical protein